MTVPHHPIAPAGHFTRVGRRAIRRSAMLVLVGAAAFLAGAAAAATDYPRDIGNWTVAVSKDGKGCFVTRAYEHPGGTTLLLGIDLEGTNHLSILNANWSIKPKDRLKLDFKLASGSYMKHFAVGMASDGKQGFVTSFEVKFPTYFAGSKLLSISKGDVPVERLNIEGSGPAVAALRNCVEAQRDKPAAAAGKKMRSDDIPIDPFAPASERKKKK
ncbi:hypothetical protein [Flavisphingomonas formosensis]|uniref:hypothetical protein n=1 Tax=Flavisphingomonas formosensis TaxID=861534 RepID=UPI001E37DFD5|nr:hypothetical protein [Sphingomonas formosensis]